MGIDHHRFYVMLGIEPRTSMHARQVLCRVVVPALRIPYCWAVVLHTFNSTLREAEAGKFLVKKCL